MAASSFTTTSFLMPSACAREKRKCLETGTPQGQCRSWRKSAHLSSERRRQRQARAAALIPLLIIRTGSEVATDLDGSRWPELGLNLGPLRETKADWHLCEAPMEHVGVVANQTPFVDLTTKKADSPSLSLKSTM